MNMKHSCTHLPEEARSVHLFKIDCFSLTSATISNNTDHIKSRCSVDGYDWEIRLYPASYSVDSIYFVGLELAFLGEAPRSRGVTATLTGRLVEYHGSQPVPCNLLPRTKIFRDPSDLTLLVYVTSGQVRDKRGPLIVECTISVLRDPNVICLPASSSGNLHRHLGDLLQSEAGSDVTFAVSGKSFAAHKNILAARSPVFMAEFFGSMEERTSPCVEIRDMDPAVFEAMLRFIYTDLEPELHDKQEPEAAAADTTVMAQHLLVAADRYGLDRLKVICEQMLTLGIDIETAASTLALGDRHNCSGLKPKCIEFIAGRSAENLDAVMETEGYRHLLSSSPSVLSELLKAANGRNTKIHRF